jgi:hypothetical protein
MKTTTSFEVIPDLVERKAQLLDIRGRRNFLRWFVRSLIADDEKSRSGMKAADATTTGQAHKGRRCRPAGDISRRVHAVSTPSRRLGEPKRRTRPKIQDYDVDDPARSEFIDKCLLRYRIAGSSET